MKDTSNFDLYSRLFYYIFNPYWDIPGVCRVACSSSNRGPALIPRQSLQLGGLVPSIRVIDGDNKLALLGQITDIMRGIITRPRLKLTVEVPESHSSRDKGRIEVVITALRWDQLDIFGNSWFIEGKIDRREFMRRPWLRQAFSNQAEFTGHYNAQHRRGYLDIL